MDDAFHTGVPSAPQHVPTVDIRPLIRGVYDARKWIALCTFVGLVAAGPLWHLKGRKYEAVVTMAVNQPRGGIQGVAPVSIASFRALLENYSVASEALQHAGLDRGGSPISARSFLSDALAVEEVRGTNLIRIHVRLNDPTLAAQVANDVAQLAVVLNRKVNQEEGSSLRDQLKSQQTDAEQRLRQAEDALLAFKRSGDVEVLRTDVKAMLKHREDLPQIESDLSAQKAGEAVAGEERASREPMLKVSRTLDSETTLMEAARAQGADFRNLVGLGVKTETPNPVYVSMDQEVAVSRTKIAQLDHQRQQIVQALATAKERGILNELSIKEVALERLEADLALARKVYEDVAFRYEQARVVVTSGSAQLQVVDLATASDVPVSWPVWAWLVAGAFLGGALALGVVVVLAAGAAVGVTLAGMTRA